MTNPAIEGDFKKKVCNEVRLAPEGKDRYRVFTPFLFDDGDRLSIVLKRRGTSWVLSDEGHTFMHLSYDFDEKELSSGTRRKVIDRTLETFGVQEEHGELISRVEHGDYGDALFSYVQALLHITDVSYLNREVVRSTFMEDFRSVVASAIPEDRRDFDWHGEEHDEESAYPVDCRIRGNGKSLFVFGIPNEEKCNVATISIMHYERVKYSFKSLAVFQDQESVSRKALARLSDVVDKQFSNLPTNRERIAAYFKEWMETTSPR